MNTRRQSVSLSFIHNHKRPSLTTTAAPKQKKTKSHNTCSQFSELSHHHHHTFVSLFSIFTFNGTPKNPVPYKQTDKWFNSIKRLISRIGVLAWFKLQGHMASTSRDSSSQIAETPKNASSHFGETMIWVSY